MALLVRNVQVMPGVPRSMMIADSPSVPPTLVSVRMMANVSAKSIAITVSPSFDLKTVLHI